MPDQLAPVLDIWTPLDYKRRWAEHRVDRAPSWVGEHARRLEAYKLLAAYLANAARAYLDTDDQAVRDRRREYGDAQLIIDTIVDAIIGEDARILVDGAGATVRTEGGEEQPLDAGADALQDWFDQWDDDERPMLSYLEGEADAVGLGDGVYVASWDATSGRPTLIVYDPGFYFPVLDTAMGRQYPTRVHIAWEFERDEGNAVVTYVRRITWQLVDTGQARRLPWNAEPTSITCLMSDGVWPLRGVDNDSEWDDLSESAATWQLNADGDEVHDLDLGIDFIPVVHLPNTSNRKEHFGRSSLGLVLQLLDELHSADTDLSLTARTTGFPPLGVEGGLPTAPDGTTISSYRPGTVFGGKVTVVDTSSSLDALLKYIEALLKRLDTNARLSGAVVGRSDPEKIASGILYALAQQPLKSMVRRMRLVRDEKYPLLHKFVARLAMQAGLLDPNPQLPKIRLAFGTFLPTDVDAEVSRIIELFAERLLSRMTAIRMLVDLGLSIEDAETEVAAIEQEAEEAAAAFAPVGGPPPGSEEEGEGGAGGLPDIDLPEA